MLPAIAVTLTTFLLELCSASPVYNMQPAFITNTIGATTGRNIRNLPCISRKNNNLHGVCMFAIDCVKSNGTHLGTCIDRFYFGSCCLIEPVHDIIDNTIESDIIPHREPPLRISNTTTTSTTISSTEVDEKVEPLSTTTTATSTISTTTPVTTEKTTVTTVSEEKTKVPTLGDYKIKENATTTTTESTSKVPTTVETTTTAQKLQTFLVVDGSTTTTKPTKPSTTAKPSAKPTAKPKPVRVTSTTGKPIKTTRPTPVKNTQKPTKPPGKPVRTTTKRPSGTQTTKKTVSTTKPTKRITTTTTTAKTTTTKSVSTTTTPKPKTTTSAPKNKTQKPEEVTTKEQLVLTTTVSNEIPVSKINVSQILETVNGNPATNEIEAAKPVEPLVTTLPEVKPGLVTWTVADDKNHTEPSSTEAATNVTEDWVPITTPDGWVLLPSVEATSANPQTSETTSSSTVSSNLTTSTEMLSSSTSSANATTEAATTTSTTTIASSTVTETKPSITYIPLETTTESVLSSSNASTTEPSLGMATTTPSTTSEGTTVAPDHSPVNMSDFTDVCGRRMFPEARIVGGEKSSYGKWPWQISLRQWRTSTYLHKCGAALLNENWAITAAHCVDQVPPSELLLRLGEHDLSTESEPYLHQERRVQIVASHPQFDPRTFEYDLALLRFYEPVTFQPNILPVCVPQTDENFVGRTAYVTGWGRLYENGPLPSVLQEVSVPVINNTVCESMYKAAGYIEHIPHIFICAGWRRGGFDSCEGDSGGPMVIQREDKRFLLAGVISWGIGCAEPNQPGVYTRISEFRDWINQILQF